MRAEGLWLVLAVAAAGCVELKRAHVAPPTFIQDAGGDAAALDSAPRPDATPVDATPTDAAPLDAQPADAAPVDQASPDLGPVDALPPVDAVFLPDWSSPDAAPDAALPDAQPEDAQPEDAQPEDAQAPDMGPACAERPERCDGLDNDCDGLVDEDPLPDPEAELEPGEACTVEVERCRIRGRWRCEDAAWRCGPSREARLADQIDAVGGCNCRQAGAFINPLPYMACSREITWSEARAVCHAAGLQLLVLEQPDETQALRNAGLFDARRVWVGLSDLELEGDFVWVDGQPLDLEASGLRWAGNHPNDDTGEEDCAELDRTDSALRARDCQIGNEFLCERLPGEVDD